MIIPTGHSVMCRAKLSTSHFIQSIPVALWSKYQNTLRKSRLQEMYLKFSSWEVEGSIVCFIAWAHVNLMGGMTGPRPYRGDVRTWTWVLGSFSWPRKPPIPRSASGVWAHRLVERYFESYSSVDKLSNMFHFILKSRHGYYQLVSFLGARVLFIRQNH